MWFKAKKPPGLRPIDLEADNEVDVEVLHLANDAIISIIRIASKKLSDNGKLALSALLYRYADQLCSPSDRDDGL